MSNINYLDLKYKEKYIKYKIKYKILKQLGGDRQATTYLNTGQQTSVNLKNVAMSMFRKQDKSKIDYHSAYNYGIFEIIIIKYNDNYQNDKLIELKKSLDEIMNFEQEESNEENELKINDLNLKIVYFKPKQPTNSRRYYTIDIDDDIDYFIISNNSKNILQNKTLEQPAPSNDNTTKQNKKRLPQFFQNLTSSPQSKNDIVNKYRDNTNNIKDLPNAFNKLNTENEPNYDNINKICDNAITNIITQYTSLNDEVLKDTNNTIECSFDTNNIFYALCTSNFYHTNKYNKILYYIRKYHYSE
jgi:hypothetical protein